MPEYHGRVFDVQPSPSIAAARYPVRTLLRQATVEPEPFERYWRRGSVLDQQREGACVGHGVTQELISDPDRVDLRAPSRKAAWIASGGDPAEAPPTTPQAFAFWSYYMARRYEDPWAGEDYDGTSSDAGMRVCRRVGAVRSWWWGSSRSDFLGSLCNLGPVVLAIPWLDGMYSAPGGLLRISGREVGWHCILANGYHPNLAVAGSVKSPKVRVMNSWGTSWGTYGSAWVEADGLWSFIDANGAEMIVPIR